MRTLAIDYGKRRVGLAMSDAGGTLATPLEVLKINSISQAVDGVAKVISDEGIERIVLGLPLNMDGTQGRAVKDVRDFGQQLEARSNLKIIYVDERLSTFQAEQDLLNAKRAGQKMTRKDKKNLLDAVAAAGFLQDFLDGKLKAIEELPPR